MAASMSALQLIKRHGSTWLWRRRCARWPWLRQAALQGPPEVDSGAADTAIVALTAAAAAVCMRLFLAKQQVVVADACVYAHRAVRPFDLASVF